MQHHRLILFTTSKKKAEGRRNDPPARFILDPALQTMADRRKSVTEKADPRAMETLRYLTLLKDSQGLFSELGKNVQKHTAQLAALASSCAVLVDNLQRIGEQEKGDLGEVIKQIAEAHKTSGDNLGKHAQAWTEHLLQDINTRLNTDKLDVANFDKNFKAKRAASVKNLKKAEANQAKANKPKMKSKSPDKAEEANAQMAQAEQEHDTMLCEQLKEVVVLERKKYCHLLQQLDTLCTAQAELYRAEVMVMENINALVAPVAASEEVIPENVIQVRFFR
jgi:Fe2+ transport system protein B